MSGETPSCLLLQPCPALSHGLSAGRTPPPTCPLRCCASCSTILLLLHHALPRTSDCHPTQEAACVPPLPIPPVWFPPGAAGLRDYSPSSAAVPAVWDSLNHIRQSSRCVHCTTERVPRKKFLHLGEGSGTLLSLPLNHVPKKERMVWQHRKDSVQEAPVPSTRV